MNTYTKEDVIKLYEELKDVNPEDYWDEEEQHFIGAFAGPIAKSSCDALCEIIHLFDKDLFILFPGHSGYSLSNRGKTGLLYAFSINENGCTWFIGKLKADRLLYGGNIKFADLKSKNELIDIIEDFNNEILKYLER